MRIASPLAIPAAAALAVLLAACNGNSSPPAADPAPPPAPTTASFEVSLVNLTAGQALSPMVALAHTDAFHLFTIGEAASVALEHLAEGGETAPLAALAGDAKSVLAVGIAGAGLPPGPDAKAVVTLTVPLASVPGLRLSMASMLGNTNDGFAGLAEQPLDTLAVGASTTLRLLGYDAGTELNTESADSVPGPATANGGGKREAFNASRDDVVNTVRVHPGIVSRDDGLATSALTQAQRWDNPVALLSVKRTR